MNYKDAFEFLSVNGHAQQQKKLEELTQIYADKEKADAERFRLLTDMITELRNENKALTRKLEQYETKNDREREEMRGEIKKLSTQVSKAAN